ncbi:hypothetical protein [Salinispora oceanensis]|uniref:hypothetical protein n=1 Tax=Salinispora oceanensis TaxID=1050199 RepID=UPI00037FA2B1|nr:hypothetical protein [Salinispora oceanensis]
MRNSAIPHLLGAVVAWSMFVAQGVVVYFGLIAFALLTDRPLGGPLGGLMMVLPAALLGAILVPSLFFPANLVGGVATKHAGLFLKLLTTSAVAAALATIYAAVVAVVADVSATGTMLACLGSVVAVLIPTAVQVVVTQAILRANSMRRHGQSPALASVST